MAEMNGVTVEKRPAPKKQHRVDLLNHIFEHLTTASHLCLVGFALYIVYLSASELDVLFSWHPICYGIGWMLLMTEAVQTVSKDNILSSRMSHALRVRYHWVIQVTAISLAAAGFAIVFINKNRSNRDHFTSWHGICGLTSMCFCIPVCLNGIAALFSIELKKYIAPKKIKFIHACCGMITVVMGSVTLVLSLYGWWFERKTNGNKDIFVFCYVAVVFGILWSLVRPMITAAQRLKS